MALLIHRVRRRTSSFHGLLGVLALLAAFLPGCRLTEEDRGLIQDVGAQASRNGERTNEVAKDLSAFRQEAAEGRASVSQRLDALETRLGEWAAAAAAERKQHADLLSNAIAKVREGLATLEDLQTTGTERLLQSIGEVTSAMERNARELRGEQERALLHLAKLVEGQSSLGKEQGEFARATVAALEALQSRTLDADKKQKDILAAANQTASALEGKARELATRQETILKSFRDLDAALNGMREAQQQHETQVRSQVERIAKQDGQAMESLRLGTAARLGAIETELQEGRAALMQQGEALIPAIRKLEEGLAKLEGRFAKLESLSQGALEEAKKAAQHAQEAKAASEANAKEPAKKEEGTGGEDGRTP